MQNPALSKIFPARLPQRTSQPGLVRSTSLPHFISPLLLGLPACLCQVTMASPLAILQRSHIPPSASLQSYRSLKWPGATK